MFYEYVTRQVKDLIPYINNARTHDETQINQIAASIKEWGFTNPVLIDENNQLIAGHGRLMAAQKLNMELVPCIILSGLTETQKKAYVLADNKLALNAGWDDELLALELESLHKLDFDLNLLGFDEDELNLLLEDEFFGGGGDGGDGEDGSRVGALAERFIIPPFSIFNSREGWWQDRKRRWIELGINSEVGRDEDLSIVALSTSEYSEKNAIEEKLGRTLSIKEYREEHSTIKAMATTSIFDPVLTEICYEWFCPSAGVILDPFAGGSVRGIVAAKTGRYYHGNDLRDEQVSANIEQAASICSEIKPVWTCGDSKDLKKLAKGVEADFIFSCPPYADLEVYSDNPKDLSTMPYQDFLKAYRAIIKNSFDMLKPDRFAAFVVGEVRDKNGVYYNFVGDTIRAFIDAGFSYYNEAIMINVAGSLPIRVGKSFSKSRKLGKTHQNILIFVKGDPVKAAENCGEVEVHIDDDQTEYGEEL